MPNLYDLQVSITTYVPKAVLAAIIIVGGLYIGRLLRKLLTNGLKRAGADAGVTHLLGQMTYWAVASIAIVLALGLFVNVTALLASLGIVAFALTFALQDVVKNFASGIILLVQRPFIVGEYVKVSSYEGTVTAVNSRSTQIHTPDGLTVLLPNTDVIDNPIVNYTRTPHRRIEIPFSVSDDADLGHVCELAVEAVKAVPGFLPEPAPDVLFKDATGGVTLNLRLWVDTLKVVTGSAQSSALDLIYHALRAEGIELSSPRQEVLVHTQQMSVGTTPPGPA
jgi:small conductance mechanosensitive channel